MARKGPDRGGGWHLLILTGLVRQRQALYQRCPFENSEQRTQVSPCRLGQCSALRQSQSPKMLSTGTPGSPMSVSEEVWEGGEERARVFWVCPVPGRGLRGEWDAEATGLSHWWLGWFLIGRCFLSCTVHK